MANRLVIILLGLALFSACSYDLDVTGVVYTPVPVNERFELSREWSAIHPERVQNVASDTYTLLIGGDAHVGGTDNLNTLIEESNNEDVAGVFIAGDISTGKEEDYDVLAAELASLQDIPVCVVPGNHDLYFHGWDSFYAYFGASSYVFTIETPDTSDVYIFLDTGGGTLGSDQLDWLKVQLENHHGKHRYTSVITHVNFFRNRFTGSTNLLNEELIVLLDLFEKYKVNMVIQGHDHERYIEEFGYAIYITLDAMLDGYKNASYMQLDVSEAGLEYQFIDF